MKNNIAILIIFFNKLEETVECMDSFLPSGENIYVLNNGSDKKLWQYLQQKYAGQHQIHFLHSDENLGPAKGRNKLIVYTKEEWLFFVDNDITIKPEAEWKNIFQQYIQANPLAAIVCPALFNVYEKEYGKHPEFILKDGEVSLQYPDKKLTNYFPSGASIVKRKVFDTYGLFEENLFAFEDYEYAIRLLCMPGKELKAFALEEITLVHNHRFQKKQVDKDAVKARYNENRLKQSFEFMEQKHGIRFDHNWEWWSKKQVADMTKRKWKASVRTVIKKVLGR